MPALQVKDCPSGVYERLRACASEENRSISQQALTIIEDYLEARANSTLPSLRPIAPDAELYAHHGVEVDYVSKRRRSFERIGKLDPLPMRDEVPSTASLLAEIRAEEAR